MAKFSKDEFKQAVQTAFKQREYKKIKISMAIFGLQCNVSYHQDGCFGKQEAAVSVLEKDGKHYLKTEQKNGIDWEWEIPE